MKTNILFVPFLLCICFVSNAAAYHIVRHGIEPETLVYNAAAIASSTTPLSTADANIKAIKYGSGITLSSVTAKLSTVAGTAFITQPSVDLRPYVGFKLTISDGTYTAVGWVKSVGTGETLGSELLANSTFETTTGLSYSFCTIASVSGGQSGNCLQLTATSNSYQYFTQALSHTVGALYKYSIHTKSGTSGNESFHVGNGSVHIIIATSGSDWTNSSAYYTGISSSNGLTVLKYTATLGTMLFDTASVKRIDTPSATGITICDSQGSATQSFSSVNASFNPNVTSFTITITRN